MGEAEGIRRAENVLEGEERIFATLRKEIAERCAQVEEKAEQGEVWQHAEIVVRKKRLEKLHEEFQQCFMNVLRRVAEDRVERCRKMANETSQEYENALIIYRS